MPCPRCQHENRPQATFCEACGTPLSVNPSGPPAPSHAELTSVLSEALEQQTATGEILQVISNSPTDLQPVFDTILAHATRLCEAQLGFLHLYDGDALRLAAHRGGATAAFVEFLNHGPIRAGPGTGIGRAVREQRAIQIADMVADAAYYERDPSRVASVELEGVRSAAFVPMLKEAEVIGLIVIHRREVRPFTDKQIELVATFANQAVIAIENVRLFNETKEALEQQTATAEILRVIARSPTDVQPVFEAIVRSAARLCDGLYCAAFRFDGELLYRIAHHNFSPGTAEALEAMGPLPLDGESVSGKAILERAVVHVPDIEQVELRGTRERARLIGMRAVLGVPMLREGRPVGTIVVGRRDPVPFTARQIELLETFADQAVIAIENVRLFTELQEKNRALAEAHANVTEALEQQTATADILKVISSSPTNVQPVFEAIAESAARLTHALFGGTFLVADGMLSLAAIHTPDDVADAFRRSYPIPLDANTLATRVAREGLVVNISDAETEPSLPEPQRRRVLMLGAQNLLIVPMVRDAQVVGMIIAGRREPGVFTDKQVTLLQTFADQAVIAIENVRLFTELEARNRELTETLEQQTATSEILRVISSSPTDVQPVFDAIVRSAVRLCDGLYGFVDRFDGEQIHLAAHYHYTPEALRVVQQMYPMRPSREQASGRVIMTGSIVHIEDVLEDPEYAQELARAGGWRGLIGVPLLREGAPVGMIAVMRGQPGRFSETQTELLKTFADQAVIAIENVRLFNETKEALEQQTATAEILRAISSSPTDTQPVFEAIARLAVDVCDGRHCTVYRFDGERVHLVAHHNIPAEVRPEFERTYPLPIESDTQAARSIRERAVVHSPDTLNDASVSEWVRRTAQAGGYRSGVVVPMLRLGASLGAIGVARSGPDGAPRPFSDKEIALLQTFADQAVIAVENVRLFNELRARTAELTRSVEQLTALGEVSQAVSSTLDLDTVLDTIVARAVQLSGTSGGVIYEYDEATQTFQLRASHRTEAEVVDALRAVPIQLGEGATGQAALRQVPVEVADIVEDRQYH